MVECYAEHVDSFNNDLNLSQFSCIIKMVKSLQNGHLSLSESCEIKDRTVEQWIYGRSKVADAVRVEV